MAPFYEIEFQVPVKEIGLSRLTKMFRGSEGEKSKGTLTTDDMGNNWRGYIETKDGKFRRREVTTDGTAAGETFPDEDSLIVWLKAKYAMSIVREVDEQGNPIKEVTDPRNPDPIGEDYNLGGGGVVGRGA